MIIVRLPKEKQNIPELKLLAMAFANAHNRMRLGMLAMTRIRGKILNEYGIDVLRYEVNSTDDEYKEAIGKYDGKIKDFSTDVSIVDTSDENEEDTDKEEDTTC